jgi:carbonic anhydrase
MTFFDPLLDRNKDFAAAGGHRDAVLPPRHPVFVITCMDPRVDPAAFLRLDLGDAMVIRNPGGRVTPDVLQSLAYINYLVKHLFEAEVPMEVAVVHHTECGSRFLAEDAFRQGWAEIVGGDDAVLAAKAVVDPEQTVRSDVELVRSGAAAGVPPYYTVSGHVYDVETGLVTTVVPAEPMHGGTASATIG